MTNGLAVFLLIGIAGFVMLDATLFDWELSLALGRRFVALLGWMAFWR